MTVLVRTQLEMAVVGAGPAGLALALHAAACLPHARVTVFDARPADHDIAADPRTLALALGSVQLLQRLAAWPGEAAQPILAVHVSQAPPSLPGAEVKIEAQQEAVPMLGAVLSYGALVSRLQQAWQAAVSREPHRLALRLGTAVHEIKPLPGAAELDCGVAERFDLVVVAEGGVFADQARKALVHDYGQTAWVGTVQLHEAAPGVAFERFTRQGPLALLPLPPAAGRQRAALVWCVQRDDDPLEGLDQARRLTLLQALLPTAAGRLTQLSPLKAFALGLNAERSLVRGRTVRIGNAAQTLHPVAGQGLNLALRDAFELVAQLRSAQDVDAALARVEWARAPDRWSMIAATDFLARSFAWQAPVLAPARALALAALQAAGPLRSLLARRMMFGLRS